MLATFIVEIFLAAFVFIIYRATAFGRWAGVLLLLLATFQISEYQICVAPDALWWPQIGFAAITLIPVCGLYLISLVTKKTHFLSVGIVMSAAFMIYFLFVPHSITSAFCGGNYVIFEAPQSSYMLFGLYYFGFLMLALWEAFEKITELGEQSKTRRVLQWFIAGYLSFLLPMAIVYVTLSPARSAIASIMCGFALVLAFIFVFKILPLYHSIHVRDKMRKKK